MGRLRAVLVLAFVATANVTSAQVTSTSTSLGPPFLAACDAEPALQRLTHLYNQGDWSLFQEEARLLLDALRIGGSPQRNVGPLAGCIPAAEVPPEGRDALNYVTGHVTLLWIGHDALGKTQLIRAVVHWPEKPFTPDLPGIGGHTRGLSEVFLSASLDARAASSYASTAEKNPLEEQLPAFAQAVFAPLSTTIGGILGGVQGTAAARAFPRAPVAPKLAVTIKNVMLPLRRASIHLQIKAKDLISSKDFTDAVRGLATNLTFDGAGRSDRARAQIAELVNVLPEVAAAKCAAPAGPDGAATADRAATCRQELDKTIKAAFDVAIRNDPSGDDVSAVTIVDRQFRALTVNALSSTAELDITFKNRPLTHFGFGAGTAVVTNGRLNKVRAKLDDTGVLQADPMPRVATMAFVNWSPGGYDESSVGLSSRERVRVFLGAALTPDFGTVGGVNVLLARGVGVIAGAGLFFAKGAAADEIGKAPVAKEDPFGLALARTAFLGISYNYK